MKFKIQDAVSKKTSLHKKYIHYMFVFRTNIQMVKGVKLSVVSCNSNTPSDEDLEIKLFT